MSLIKSIEAYLEHFNLSPGISVGDLCHHMESETLDRSKEDLMEELIDRLVDLLSRLESHLISPQEEMLVATLTELLAGLDERIREAIEINES